jgi:predicted nuclease of restriction endonuclease-like (RecB) superfamily
MKQPATIENLISVISETDLFFKNQAQRQVNVALTLRNWLIGLYIVEYELNGADRAEYGEKLIDKLSVRLKTKKLRGFSQRSLQLCRSFYLAYPQIQQSMTVESYFTGFEAITILQSLTAKFIGPKNTDANPISQSVTAKSPTDADKLINLLSFTHIIELLKADTVLKRCFYEVEAIKNAWSVRELQRAMNSMLFERTGLSTDKQAVLDKHIKQDRLLPEDIFRNPYMLEFLGLKEEAAYSESDLEEAIIGHLQTFLLEMGRGFCFESRQKRITFDNTHYRIDLVFYHRILKCHVLIDLKLGEFTHADSGQMNVYLNYYKENEAYEGDNPPIGIILCATKNESLVRYATANLPHKLFVSKYMVNLPSETELEKIIKEEQEKLGL